MHLTGKKFAILISIACAAILVAVFGFIIFKENQPAASLKSDISGAVVPHHDLVAAKRAEFFSDLAKKIPAPETIILVSPNHYSAGSGRIQTTLKDFNLNEGAVAINQKVASSLIQKGLASNEPASFTDEHGIYNILADIKNNFPATTIVPLILENVSGDQLAQLERGLEQSCAQCLMIASVDFSHYQPAILAQLHDDLTIRYMEDLDISDLLKKAEVDSGPSLALLSIWAENHQTLKFNLRAHTNSGIMSQDPDLETTTHVFGWYEMGGKVVPDKSVSFIFGGDVMFTRMIATTFGADFNQAFSKLGDRVFWGTDAAVVNLEGTLALQPVDANIPKNQFVFQFSPDIVRTLSFLHINAVSQANNHSDNAGEWSQTMTRSTLDSARIQSFGGSTVEGISRVAHFKGQGLELVVIGINLTYPDQKAEAIVPLIKQYKTDPSVRVIVMPHWGTEYIAVHSPGQENAAHNWIDAGADMIIGSHPHVIQDTELYRGVPIIYSLGNFLFDQTFSQAVQQDILIAGKFTEKGLEFFALPVQSIRYKPQLMTGPGKQGVLNMIYLPFLKYLDRTSAGNTVKLNK